MTMQKILCATDLSESGNQALKHALRLARKERATVDVLYVDTHPVTPVAPQLVMDAIREIVKIEGEGREEVKYKLVIKAEDDVVEVIKDYAEAHLADLITMGTHGRQGLRHFFLGSVAEAVIHEFNGPVLTARGTTEPPDTISRILVPIDFSMFSGGALQYAKALAHKFDAEIMLIFVAEERVVPFFSDTGIPAFTMMRMPVELMENAERALAQLYENTDGPIMPVQYVVVEGKPVAEIIQCAETQNADLIVMATRGTSEKKHWPMGSVAEGVLRRATCPVITATTFGPAYARGSDYRRSSELQPA